MTEVIGRGLLQKKFRLIQVKSAFIPLIKIVELLLLRMFLVADYVKSLESNISLLDKLSRKDFHEDEEGENIYPPHLCPSEIHTKIKSGKLVQGTFYASRENFLEGSVNAEGSENTVSLPD